MLVNPLVKVVLLVLVEMFKALVVMAPRRIAKNPHASSSGDVQGTYDYDTSTSIQEVQRPPNPPLAEHHLKDPTLTWWDVERCIQSKLRRIRLKRWQRWCIQAILIKPPGQHKQS